MVLHLNTKGFVLQYLLNNMKEKFLRKVCKEEYSVAPGG